jgi:hypothetical protein
MSLFVHVFHVLTRSRFTFSRVEYWVVRFSFFWEPVGAHTLNRIQIQFSLAKSSLSLQPLWALILQQPLLCSVLLLRASTRGACVDDFAVDTAGAGVSKCG